MLALFYRFRFNFFFFKRFLKKKKIKYFSWRSCVCIETVEGENNRDLLEFLKIFYFILFYFHS